MIKFIFRDSVRPLKKAPHIKTFPEELYRLKNKKLRYATLADSHTIDFLKIGIGEMRENIHLIIDC